MPAAPSTDVPIITSAAMDVQLKFPKLG